MAIWSYEYSCRITTTTSDYDVLQDDTVKAIIQERVGITEDEYQQVITDGGFNNIRMTMLFNQDTRIRVNNDDYSYHVLIDREVIELGGGNEFVRRKIQTVEIEDNGVEATIVLNIL